MSETKTITEYRVVAETRDGCRGAAPCDFRSRDLGRMRERAFEVDHTDLYTNVRIEKRQVTYGPWIAVEEG